MLRHLIDGLSDQVDRPKLNGCDKRSLFAKIALLKVLL